jgi:hypothetical protein
MMPWTCCGDDDRHCPWACAGGLARAPPLSPRLFPCQRPQPQHSRGLGCPCRRRGPPGGEGGGAAGGGWRCPRCFSEDADADAAEDATVAASFGSPAVAVVSTLFRASSIMPGPSAGRCPAATHPAVPRGRVGAPHPYGEGRQTWRDRITTTITITTTTTTPTTIIPTPTTTTPTTTPATTPHSTTATTTPDNILTATPGASSVADAASAPTAPNATATATATAPIARVALPGDGRMPTKAPDPSPLAQAQSSSAPASAPPVSTTHHTQALDPSPPQDGCAGYGLAVAVVVAAVRLAVALLRGVPEAQRIGTVWRRRPLRP